MNRTGLLIALAVAAAVGLVFGLYPKLDLLIVEPFFDPAAGVWDASRLWVMQLRSAASFLIALIPAPAFLALALKLVLPRRPLLVPGRPPLLITVTLPFPPDLPAHV